MRKSALALRTDLEIRALKPGDKAYERPVAGVGGLFVSVGKNGDKSFRLLYRVAPERKLHAMRIGPYPEVPLKQAVTDAKSAIGLAVKGVDPAAAIRKAREQADPQFGFASLRRRYLDEHCAANLKPRSADEAARCLTNEWGRNAKFENKDVRTITAAMVVDHLSVISKRGSHDANALANLKGFYRWMKGKKVVTVAPTDGVRHNSKSKPRTRFLSDAEIVAVWKAAEKIGYPYGHVVKLFLLTCSRRNEVAGLQWSELDYDEARWIMPHERTKKRRNSEPKPHLVPLSTLALEVLKSCPRISDTFVFAAERSDNKTGHISNWDARKAELDRLTGLQGFNQHDTRRTVTTGLGRVKLPDGSKVARHVKQSLIHHSAGKDDTMGKHYDLYEYEDEKREALEAWANHIQGLLKRHDGQSKSAASAPSPVADGSVANDALAHDEIG